ncbi:MAG: amino acid permease [Candidatus Omnitrophota bacterium]
MKKKLDRTLGLFSAITISVGTMIGSAIFVLAGTSYETAGPAASLAVFLAGLAAFPTALSFAELVTIVPHAGGGYVYAREAAGNGLVAFITGWGFWLAYAMSCGLYAIGFGNFLNYFFPSVPVYLAAYVLIIYVMFTNIRGVENTGLLQDVITTGLVLLLGLYIVSGFFFADLSYQRPFFPRGMSGMWTAMGFLYITYIGYGLVTTASEEIVDPEKTIPRAIIISLAVVIFIKAAVFFLGSALIPWERLVTSVTNTPMTNTAVRMGGSLGGKLFALAGIFATLSSINTAMMAASRTSFAMARDNHLPAMFKNINARTKTPIFSVLVAAFIVAISTSLKNLENISTVTSVFALTGYSFVNVALIIFREKKPDAKRSFRVPFYPLMPVAGIAVNIFLVIRLMLNNFTALSAAFGITAAGILYYFIFLPGLKRSPKIISPMPIAPVQIRKQYRHSGYKVLVPVASPATMEAIIDVSLKIAAYGHGIVQPVHIVDVPEMIPLDSGYDDVVLQSNQHKQIVLDVNRIAGKSSLISEPLLMLSRHVIPSLKKTVMETMPDMVILGWHPSNFAYRMLSGFVYRAMEELPANIGIFKKGQNAGVKKILYPYGGGLHSQAVAQIVKRLFLGTGAAVTFLHIVDRETPGEEISKIREIMETGVSDLGVKGDIRIVESDSMVSAVIEESAGHDLVVMGASYSWGIASNITGMRTDRIMERITCSGLVIRQYEPLLKQKFVRRACNYLKEFLLD